MTENADPKKLYLLDGTSNIFRAFYAIRKLTSPAHRPTNATFGFTQMVRKLLQDEKPDYVAAVFDRPEPTHRHKVFPQYKANRMAPPEELVAQIPDVKRVCRVLGVPTVEMPGFEADDLIGTLALHDEPLDGFADRHDLVDPHASLVARVVTACTADGFVEFHVLPVIDHLLRVAQSFEHLTRGRIWLFAVLTELADQSLSQRAVDRRRA